MCCIFKKSGFVLLALLLTGCTQVPRDGDFSAVKDLVGERIPQEIHWYQGGEEDEQAKRALDELLINEPLTATSAVQIALLNNQRLQAEYEKIRVGTTIHQVPWQTASVGIRNIMKSNHQCISG